MERKAHSAMVAGVSSTVVAAWIRSRTREAYDPAITPPSLKDRLHQRAPMVAAGLGFTGLSTAVAGYFDTAELAVLGDAENAVDIHRQMGNHHELHSLPYLGSALSAAHLIRHSSKRFGEWLSEKLDLSESIQAVIDAADSLANWVIGATGSGVFGHLLGDLPTSGQGGSALQLLKPITNRNFCLKWVSSASPTINRYLTIAGTVLAGAAWSFSGLHLLSWEPPERSLRKYVDRIGECDSWEEAVDVIFSDFKSLFNRVFERSQTAIWNSPLFAESATAIESEPASRWYRMKFDTERIFDIPSLDIETLRKEDLLPSDVISLIEGKSLYSPEYFGVYSDDKSIDLSENINDSTPLFRDEDEDVISLLREEESENTPLVREDSEDDSRSIFTEYTAEESESQ
jgi:hypothetical protein